MHHDGARSAPQPEQPPTLEALVTRGPSRTTLAAPRWGKAVQGQIAFEVTTSDLAIVASPHTTRSEEVTDAPGERAELALECPNSLTDCVPFSHQATEPQRSRFVKSSSGPPDIRFRNGTVALVADVGIRDTRAMRSRRHLPVRSAPSSAFAGYRFPPESLPLAVRWYLRFGLSYRDVEELLAERGIEVDHVSIYRWVQRFAPEFAEAARPRQHVIGDRWHVDETYLKVGGTWRYLFRAIDQFGQVIDVYLSPRRNGETARRFFDRAIDRTRVSPVEVTTDRYRVYPRVLGELLPAAFHDTEVHANNLLEADHGPLKARLRPMRGLKRTVPPG